MASRSKQRQTRRQRGQRALSRGLWQRGKWWFIGGGVAGVIGLLVVLTSALSGPQVTGGEVNVASGPGSSVAVSSPDLPDFPVILYQGQDLVGSQEPLFASLLDGKPVVLNYWASNCPPCTAEMPEFEKVWQRYKDRVLFVGLDVGRFFPGFGGQETSKKELQQLGITYVAGTPPSVDVVQQLEVQGLPSTVFITSDGKVHKKWVGVLNESKLTELVEGLLTTS